MTLLKNQEVEHIKNPTKMLESIKKNILEALDEVKAKEISVLVNERYDKFRQMGNFF